MREHEYILDHKMRFHGPREFRALGPAAVSKQLSDADGDRLTEAVKQCKDSFKA